jgi:ferredoxin
VIGPVRIQIDTDRCAMAGECIYNHPRLFEWGDDDLPRVRVGELHGESDRLEARQAAEVCPSGAITVVA